MSRWFTVILLAAASWLSGADDPYAAWMQGRPQDAVGALHRAARSQHDWGLWYDSALAARAAGEIGPSHAWLLESHRLAPARPEPLAALRADGLALGPTWLERLGPVAWPGCGWLGVALCAGAGACLGWWCCARRRRTLVAGLGIVLVAVAAPGALAAWLDARAPLVVAVRDTHLVDSTGATTVAVAAGSLLTREPQAPWSGRVLVRMSDGVRGYLSLADTHSDP